MQDLDRPVRVEENAALADDPVVVEISLRRGSLFAHQLFLFLQRCAVRPEAEFEAVFRQAVEALEEQFGLFFFVLRADHEKLGVFAPGASLQLDELSEARDFLVADHRVALRDIEPLLRDGGGDQDGE